MKTKCPKAKKFGRRYPWREWFARKTFFLIQGVHYDCMTHAMAQMVRNVAASATHRLRVSVNVWNDRKIEVVVLGKKKRGKPV